MYPQHWPDTRMVQEITEGFCFAPADVKFPDPDFLLPWGFKSALPQGEGHQAPMRWGRSVVCALSSVSVLTPVWN